ncbi:MAG: hypothetical protein WC280_01480 [Patescibacteria group bacterium]
MKVKVIAMLKCLAYPSKRRAAERLRNMSIKCGDIERAVIFSRLSFQGLEFEDLLKILIKNIEDGNIVRASKTIKRVPEGSERGLLKCSCSEHFFRKYEKFSKKENSEKAKWNYDRAELALQIS